uniref:Uncharacterized protein n=1 Tax=Percolomonas cosmopolitus TaxID=63605 RepID=A0A7S1KS49_9EUKA|mmetsp:Transcript_6685/g.25051  ORF Transcript_6685/g.25051 Transcript_6685/m.25051 type:complete len:332 (+) Transcript_6685:31-1026(+)
MVAPLPPAPGASDNVQYSHILAPNGNGFAPLHQLPNTGIQSLTPAPPIAGHQDSLGHFSPPQQSHHCHASSRTSTNIVQESYSVSPKSPSQYFSSISATINDFSNTFSRFNDLDKTNVFFRAGYSSILFTIVVWLARLITGGLCTPFLDYWYYRNFAKSIRLNGYRLSLNATIFDFVILQLVHYMLLLITSGLYILFQDHLTAAFVDSRLQWNMEAMPFDAPKDFRISGKRARFTFFGARPWFFWDILFYLGMIFTMGLAYPWLTQAYYKRWFHNARVDGNRMQFRGKGMDFFWLYLHNWFMTLITFGLYKYCGCWDRELHRYLDTKIAWY